MLRGRKRSTRSTATDADPTSPTDQVGGPAGTDEVPVIAERMVGHLGLPGLAVAVFGPEGRATTWCLGHADPATDRPWTPSTPSRLGSISKTVTTAALLRHVDAGRLDLDQPIAPLVPEPIRTPAGAAPITARHLLTHTSGIGELASWSALRHPMWAVGGADPVAPLPSLSTLLADGVTAEAAPGQRWVYSNPAYSVVGRLVEVLDRRDLPDVLDDDVLAPLGMTHSTARAGRIDRRTLAVGQLRHGTGFRPARPFEVATVSAGGVTATVEDLARLGAAVLTAAGGADTALGSAAIMGQALAVQRSAHPLLRSVGLTWWHRTLAGRPTIGHGGNMPGYSAGLQVCPSAGVGVAVLTNRAIAPSAEFGGSLVATTVLAHLLRTADGDRIRRQPEARAAEPDVDLAGTYGLPGGRLTNLRGLATLGGELRVEPSVGRWRVRSPIGLLADGALLEPVDHPDPVWRFEVRGVTFHLVARAGDDGRIETLVLDGAPCPTTFHRRSDWETPRARLALAGAASGAAFALGVLSGRRDGRR